LDVNAGVPVQRSGALRPEMASRKLLVLAFVREYIETNGASPSFREIAHGLGCSTTRVKEAIRKLVAEGLLLRTPSANGQRSRLQLPSVRDAALRQLRELGWMVDEDIGQLGPPGVTLSTLLPPPILTYRAPEAIEDSENDGGRGEREHRGKSRRGWS
jgi:SOS-response transcriptional repressor LexA